MVELNLSGIALGAYARERHLSAQEVAADPGYLVHAWLAEALGNDGPKVFRIVNHQPNVRVLGYCTASPEQMLETLDLNASPSVAQALVDGAIAGKKMPHVWVEGTRLAFEVLATPIVRSGNRSVDAFLSACNHSANVGKRVDRQQVYADWLSRKLEGAALVDRVEQAEFALTTHVRKKGHVGDKARDKYMMCLPRVLYRGELTVKSAAAFGSLLGKGVGRETPFGYGMMLLRKAA